MASPSIPEVATLSMGRFFVGNYAMVKICSIKSLHIGVYETKEEAAKSYDIKVMNIFGNFAKTNFSY
jgi:hypothetical protein